MIFKIKIVLGGFCMNKEWSKQNKEIQILLGKELTYKEGIQKLIAFRGELFEQISNIVSNYPREAFYQMPFQGANGYHSKTLAYSIWHIFRIEDIVAHELIKKDKQILFTDSYEKKIQAPIITTRWMKELNYTKRWGIYNCEVYKNL